MWETPVQLLGWEDPLEKGTATHSSILAWRIPWGCKESSKTEWLSLSTWLLWQWKCRWDTSWNRLRDDKRAKWREKWNETKSNKITKAAINIQPLALNRQTGCFPAMLACGQKLDVPSSFQTCGISTNGSKLSDLGWGGFILTYTKKDLMNSECSSLN